MLFKDKGINIKPRITNTKMSSNKVIRVSYSVDDAFLIPKNINLEDTTQVESWGVKYNTLYIYLVNGKEIKINSQGWINEFDYKYPSDDPTIEEADELGCFDEEDEGFNEIDVGELKEDEEEEDEEEDEEEE